MGDTQPAPQLQQDVYGDIHQIRKDLDVIVVALNSIAASLVIIAASGKPVGVEAVPGPPSSH